MAAALKEAGLKSGQQYMAELKLLHIEAVYDVEAWRKRTFDLSKKSLESRKRQRSSYTSSRSESRDSPSPRTFEQETQDKGIAHGRGEDVLVGRNLDVTGN